MPSWETETTVAEPLGRLGEPLCCCGGGGGGVSLLPVFNV